MDPEQAPVDPGTIAPPPMSPPGFGENTGASFSADAGGFVGPEHMQQLESIAGKVRDKIGEFESQKFVANNQLESRKGELIREFLLGLEASGVDISNQEEVAAYIESIRAVSPELAELYEGFVSMLFGTDADVDGLTTGEFAPLPPEGMEMEEVESEEEDLMEESEEPDEEMQAPQAKYENLSQNLRERFQG